MDMQGLLGMFGGGSANAAPSLYNAAATGGASGTGYIGNLSPDQQQGLLGLAGQMFAQQQGGQGGQQQLPPTPAGMVAGYHPMMRTQMPQGLFPQQGMGLLGGQYGN